MERYSITKFIKEGYNPEDGTVNIRVKGFVADSYRDLGGHFVSPELFVTIVGIKECGSCATVYDHETQEMFYLIRCDF